MASRLTERINKKLQIAAIKIMPHLPQNSGQILLYSSAVLAIAAVPGADLPTTLSNIATGIGVEALGSLLDRMANGKSVSIEEIQQVVETALADSRLAERMSTDQALRQEIESLDAWRQQILFLVEHNQQLGEALLADVGSLGDDVSFIRHAVETNLATRDQVDELKRKVDLVLLTLAAQGKIPISAEVKRLPMDKNPFGITGCIRDPERYLVRQAFTNDVLQELQKHQSVSIIGESQTGKSSFLRYLQRIGPQLLNYEPEDFVYINMQLLTNDDDFFDCLCEELSIPSVNGFRLQRQLRHRRIVVCLDEVEKMRFEGFTRTVRDQLRGLADGQDAPLTLVIASHSSLSTIFADSSIDPSPLANICMQLKMPNFSMGESLQLVEKYLGTNQEQLSPQQIGDAWQRSSKGHPQRLQRAFYRMLNGR